VISPRGQAELQPGQQRGGAVAGHVLARHPDRHPAEHVAVEDGGPGGGLRAHLDVDQPQVAVLGGAVGAHAGRGGHGAQPRRARVVGAQDDEAGRVQRLQEPVEGRLDRGQVAVVVQVVGLDVGDDRAVRGQQQEGAVALVGLGDEDVALAGVRVAARLVEVAADGEGGVHAAGLHRDGEHRGGRGLPVRAGHGDAALAGHHRGQRHRTRQHPQAPLAGGGELGLSSRMAVETTTEVGVASGRVVGASPPGHRARRSASSVGVSRRSLPETGTPRASSESGDAAHPGAAECRPVHRAELLEALAPGRPRPPPAAAHHRPLSSHDVGQALVGYPGAGSRGVPAYRPAWPVGGPSE
jgi:hypothetical protein